jgi:acyl-CoA reductase-like NAD-dependent aldehyde dehydrogenase
MPGHQRSAILAKWASLYVRDWEEHAALDALCMGQPVAVFKAVQLPCARPHRKSSPFAG